MEKSWLCKLKVEVVSMYTRLKLGIYSWNQDHD